MHQTISSDIVSLAKQARNESLTSNNTSFDVKKLLDLPAPSTLDIWGKFITAFYDLTCDPIDLLLAIKRRAFLWPCVHD